MTRPPAVALAVVLAAGACGSRTTAPPAAPPAATVPPSTTTSRTTAPTTTAASATALPPGSPASVNGGTLTVVSVRSSARPLSRYGPPPTNGRLLLVQVKAQASGTLALNPFDFAAITADGARYNTAAGSAIPNTVDPALHATTLAAGDRVMGNVVFDVPAGPGTIAYVVSGRAVATWRYA